MFLQGNFYCQGKKYRLTLKDSGLSWEPEGNCNDLFRSVLLSEIVSCWLCPRGSLECYSSLDSESIKECSHSKKGSNWGLTVEFCRRKKKSKWATSVIVFVHVAKEIVHAWHEAIWTALRANSDRPQNLFVVINPVGGKRKADHIYNKKIHPLFFRAEIKIMTTKTKYKGHGSHLIREAAEVGHLKECDGIVAVGGDGLVNECATGIFILSSQNLGINPHDPEIDLPVTRIRLGIIPSGSTDATCYATHGTSDPITAALHIIMGDKRGVDVAAIHTNNQLQRIVTGLVSYGYFGDLLRHSENLRCMGPPRYLLSGLQQVLRNRSYPVTIRAKRRIKSQLTDSNSSESTCSDSMMASTISCNSICSVCSYYGDDTDRLISDSSSSDENWIEISGDFSIVSAAISSCACRLTPQGVSPSAHLGDGQSDLILVNGSSRAKLLSYLYHTGVTGKAANLDHVKMIRTNEIQFCAAPNSRSHSSSWNCDGEELEALSLSIKVHRQKLNLFCRGIEDSFVPTLSK